MCHLASLRSDDRIGVAEGRCTEPLAPSETTAGSQTPQPMAAVDNDSNSGGSVWERFNESHDG